MALLDAYATEVNYRDAVKGSDTTSDPTILARLTAASRLIDVETGGRPGRFNKSAVGAVRHFDVEPRGAIGRVPGVSDPDTDRRITADVLDTIRVDEFDTITEVKVDTTNDGTFDQAVDGANRQSLPHNADEFSEPFDRLRLVPFSSNNELTIWPRGTRRIEITGTWGWPAVPTLVRDLCIGLAHDLWDILRSGSTMTLQQIDIGFRLSLETNRMLQRARDAYAPKVVIV